MPLFFLVPLSAGLVTGYICKESSDEIAQLSGVAAVISFIVSLVLAPWEIQLLLLVLVITTTQKLLLKNEHKLKLHNYNSNVPENIEQQENHSLKIKQQYRGVKDVKHNIAGKIVEAEITGKYRGIPWKIHRLIRMRKDEI